MDTKKKELIGNYDNAGQQWLPAGPPPKVEGHDFLVQKFRVPTPMASTLWGATRVLSM